MHVPARGGMRASSGKHLDTRRMVNQAEVRRSRPLGSSPPSRTVGNLRYGFYWYLLPGWTIQYEIKLTGIIGRLRFLRSAAGFRDARCTWTLWPHQPALLQCALDMMVDGLQNSLDRGQLRALPWGPTIHVAMLGGPGNEAFDGRPGAASIEPRTAR